MPTKFGLALLASLYSSGSALQALGKDRFRLSAGRQEIDSAEALSLVELGCLLRADEHTYVLSEKGACLARRPAERVEQGTCWALTGVSGRKIHLWKKYLVQGRFLEYESACGLARLAIWKEEQMAGFYCAVCLGKSPPVLAGGG